MSGEFGRRALLASASALLFAPSALAATARRSVAGGRLSFRVPWPMSRIDPHVLSDMGAALFGSALFDTLYRPGASGYESALAENEPAQRGGKWRVLLREGLTTASGKPIRARDVATSVERARSRGASGWLANVGKPRVVSELEIDFAAVDDQKLMAALASPMVAIVPHEFRPDFPDGTGPFRVSLAREQATFRRNANAAMGPAFLEEMKVRGCAEVAESLRAFESGKDDLGWLGTGLYEARKGSKLVDAGALGWVLLATGKEAGSWDTPGAAQALTDAISYASMAHLKLGSAWTESGSERWQGPPCDLIVVDDCPWLIEVAKTLSALIGTPGHEVTPKSVSPQEFATRRKSRQFALALDVARSFANTPFGVYASLAAASDPSTAASLSKRPPLGERTARSHGRHFRVGVVGDARAEFGRLANFRVEADKPTGVAWGSAKIDSPRRQAQRTP